MTKNKEVNGFALLCDQSGIVKSVLRDDFGMSYNTPVGKLFVNQIDPVSRSKSLNFLLEIKEKKISLDYRFNIVINDKAYSFYFIGVALGDEVLIIGANNHKEAVDFTNHLQQINNEQANKIRELLKEDSKKSAATDDETQQLFDEITELNNNLINLQRELTRKNTELRRLNDLKNKFIGMAAHDLRNPLANIISFSDFLRDELKDSLSENHYNFLKNISHSSEFMFSLIEDLLDYSKIESGKIQMNLEKLDVAKKLKGIVQNFNTLSERKKITIDFSPEQDNVEITADKNKIEQVFQNIINNAIKFSPQHSKINVRLKLKEDSVLIEVQDFGVGIENENLDKVFVPFTSIASKGTAGEKSTGLGMSIVKNIVENHKGKIWLESEPGKGTTFFVELPK